MSQWQPLRVSTMKKVGKMGKMGKMDGVTKGVRTRMGSRKQSFTILEDLDVGRPFVNVNRYGQSCQRAGKRSVITVITESDNQENIPPVLCSL